MVLPVGNLLLMCYSGENEGSRVAGVTYASARYGRQVVVTDQMQPCLEILDVQPSKGTRSPGRTTDISGHREHSRPGKRNHHQTDRPIPIAPPARLVAPLSTA